MPHLSTDHHTVARFMSALFRIRGRHEARPRGLPALAMIRSGTSMAISTSLMSETRCLPWRTNPSPASDALSRESMAPTMSMSVSRSLPVWISLSRAADQHERSPNRLVECGRRAECSFNAVGRQPVRLA